LNIKETSLQGLTVVETVPYEDVRGTFSRLFCERHLSAIVGQRRIVQFNHSRTVAVGAIRGLHFQYPPFAEMKLVRCIRGRVWDVAIDLRANSKSFLNWHAEELTPENHKMMVIPEGFAHGYQVIDPNSELLYLHTAFHTPSSEGGLRFDDPTLSITWPIRPSELSVRDANLPRIESTFKGLVL